MTYTAANQNTEQTAPEHAPVYLKDYRPPAWLIETVELDFNIFEDYTRVTSSLKLRRNPENPQATIWLDGIKLDIEATAIDGAPLTEGRDYTKKPKGVTITKENLPDELTFSAVTRIYPDKNTELSGLYRSGGTWCTQCEAEGFRRITLFPDRPDVMSRYKVRIEAACEYPVLLSNGNMVDCGPAETDGRHYAVWEDPSLKPCYLFAVVCGDLVPLIDTHTTPSGRTIDLRIFVRDADLPFTRQAMDALKKAMEWDEKVYGLEYDLDQYNIVAIPDFNMAAMENKSLNVFNTAAVLADPELSSDLDVERVDTTIGHEYFHNWSGNRVTCRDWFQLSLKEGLTVFRHQSFGGDLRSRDVQRIDDVALLRRIQFPEDAGPMAHPVRPDSYIEIDNFYTMTIYEKGAEIIRMIHTLLGPQTYRKATDLYFSRHDGQAVTCEDFLKCMEDASGRDLSQFWQWYVQAGTPTLTVKRHRDPQAKTYRLTFTQSSPPTPGQSDKKPPLHMPLAVGLLDRRTGKEIALDTQGQTSTVLELRETQAEFTFENIETEDGQEPVPSILRGLSAPVYLNTDLTPEEHAFLMAHDTDGFNRWDAAQNLLGKIVRDGAQNIPDFAKDAWLRLLNDAKNPHADRVLLSKLMEPPLLHSLIETTQDADPVTIFESRERLISGLGYAAGRDLLKEVYTAVHGDQDMTPQGIANRAIANLLLQIIFKAFPQEGQALASVQYQDARLMTERAGAMAVLTNCDGPAREDALTDFYERFRNHPVVIDKWFAWQVQRTRDDTLDKAKDLCTHPDFKISNPNRARAVYIQLAMNNPYVFHRADGEGYAFLIDAIKTMNAINPQMAGMMLWPFRNWKNLSQNRQAMIRKYLEDLQSTPGLSAHVYETLSKYLA